MPLFEIRLLPKTKTSGYKCFTNYVSGWSVVKTGEYPTINEFSSYLDMDLVAALVTNSLDGGLNDDTNYFYVLENACRSQNG